MNFRVSRVAELLQQRMFRIAGGNFFRFLNSAFHAFRAFGQHQIRAQRFSSLRRSMLMVSGMVSVSL
jgi:hypothetical protein